MSSSATTAVEPSSLEEGRGGYANDQANGKQNGDGHVKHHHHHHHAKRVRALAHHRKKKREAAKIQGKLPGLMQTDGTDIGKLRKRLILKNELIAAIAEFVGTFLFLFFAFGIATQAGQQQISQNNGGNANNNRLDTSQLLFSSLGFGFSLAVNAWVFFRISGGLFNPAVTLGLFLCGALSWYRACILFVVQFVAAIAAAGIAQLVLPGGINARTKLGNTTTLAQGFFIEMFCTALLMFAIYMLAAEKHKGTFIAPVGIGLALFLAEMFATGLTGGSLNPARTLGPDVIAASFEATTWIYYTAPFVGTGIAAGIYWLLKVSRYETANEGQDDDANKTLVMRDTQGRIMGAAQPIATAEAQGMAGVYSEAPVATGNNSQVSLVDGKDGSRRLSNASAVSIGPEPAGDGASIYGGSAGMLAPPSDEKDAASRKSMETSRIEEDKSKEPALGVSDFAEKGKEG